MKTQVVVDGKLPLYSFVDGNPPQSTVKYAGGFDPLWNGETIWIIDWKITGDKVRLTYQTRNGLYDPVHESDLPLVSITTALAKPGRNFEWQEFSSCWRNKKTGQRIPVY